MRWIPEYQKDKNYYQYEKYFIKNNVFEFTDEEYEKCIKNIDQGWDKEETKYLLDLCRQFD